LLFIKCSNHDSVGHSILSKKFMERLCTFFAQPAKRYLVKAPHEKAAQAKGRKVA